MSKKEDNIRSFPGYHVTRDGLLYSRYGNGGVLTDKYRLMSTYKRFNGYRQVVLKIRSKGLIRRAYIHRLVAEAYIPNPLNKPCVCHKDSNRDNNHVDNLYWGTYKENFQQASKEGKLTDKRVLKFLVLSDLHIHLWSKFQTRTDTAFDILDILSDESMKLKVPVLFCGDLLHEANVMSQEMALLLKEKFSLLDEKDWAMYCISGNHTLKHINRIDSPTKSWETWLTKDYRFLKLIDFERVHIGKFYIHGVPYIDNNVGLSEYIKRLNTEVGKPRSKHVLLLHTDYPGAKDTDGREVGSVENLNINVLNKFDLVLCGHIHKPQRLSKKVYMIGAPNQQRRTDKGCSMGYWRLYSDLSMEFVALDQFPRFIDVESENEIKDDGNYYTIIPKKASVQVNTNHKITKRLSKKSLARHYLREKGIKDKAKLNLLVETLNQIDS